MIDHDTYPKLEGRQVFPYLLPIALTGGPAVTHFRENTFLCSVPVHIDALMFACVVASASDAACNFASMYLLGSYVSRLDYRLLMLGRCSARISILKRAGKLCIARKIM